MNSILARVLLAILIPHVGIVALAQDPEVVAMRDTFCAVQSGPFYHLSKVGLVVALALPAARRSSIQLTESITTACDSPEARAAKVAYFVPALRLDLLGGEGLIAIDAFGKSYWGGDWELFLAKRRRLRELGANRDGAVSYSVLKELEIVKGAKAPMLFALETAMYFRRGRASNLHTVVYYLRNGDHAIEIRVVTGNRNLIGGAMSQVEQGVLCRDCQPF